MSRLNRKSLKQELDKLVDSGKSIIFRYDGGNDSGSFYLYIKEGEIEEELEDGNTLADNVFELMNSSLGYGSFAGDYYCDGELIYNKDTGCFEGSGTDTNEEYELLESDTFKIAIPKDLWFSSVELGIDGTSDDSFSDMVSCRIIVKEGPVIEEHNKIASKIEKYLQKAIQKVINNCDFKVSSVYDDLTITKDSFKEGPDGFLYYLIDGISASVPEEEEITFSIPILEE